jgi:hypothetical protein
VDSEERERAQQEELAGSWAEGRDTASWSLKDESAGNKETM